IDRWWRWLQPGQLRRLHQKLCVVDGELAFVGGINIIDDRLDLHHGETELPRLDFAVALRGAAVLPVAQAARAVWTRAWLGRDFGEELLALVRSPEPIRRLRRLARRLRMPRGRRQRGSPVSADWQDMAPVCAAFVLRDNLRQRRTIERAYIDAIRAARERVDLISPYFYPGHAFRRALRDAARRGVQVRLLLQGKLDYRIAGLAAQALYAELLGHGVQIFEYMPAYLHAKICVVDESWATVGSSNIDPLSLLLNLEANVLVHDAEFARAVALQFEDAAAVSCQVDLKRWGGTGLRGMLTRALVAWTAYVYLRVAGATGRY
ncbi:MAG TPA: phospholipase D-like domain-containing protein, partial [Roseateles sp.]|nr:phospholipase D-like domain-containing protein [Roseateles sp.]